MVTRGQSVQRIRAVLSRISAQAADVGEFDLGERVGVGPARGAIGVVLSPALRVGSAMLWLAYFMGLVIFYAMINWMPVLFKDAGLEPQQATLISALFPLGGMLKQEVRELARVRGLPVHDKPDSTGICFIGERPFAQFLARYLHGTPGPIESADGRLLGQHRGLPFYTLGQRAGLAIGGARGCAQQPWYVARKDSERNALIVVQRHEQHRLEADAVATGALNWLCAPPSGSFDAEVKLRYRQPGQPARVTIRADGSAWIEFATAQRAATPGQFAVLYQHGRCLGGGAIERHAEAGDRSCACDRVSAG